ncbi:MAG: hypothetical protein LW826_02485, partial [Candidatus Jidaibacter sp.]|nr:hypothetical protein [Candidatus Jidaibacter sp.]
MLNSQIDQYIKGLQDNDPLPTELYLRSHKICPVGAQYIAEALKINTSLIRLYLTENNIGPVGAQYIAEALKINTSLIRLYLTENNIGDAGAQYIAEALKR